jgi:hypothetical protein
MQGRTANSSRERRQGGGGEWNEAKGVMLVAVGGRDCKRKETLTPWWKCAEEQKWLSWPKVSAGQGWERYVMRPPRSDGRGVEGEMRRRERDGGGGGQGEHRQRELLAERLAAGGERQQEAKASCRYLARGERMLRRSSRGRGATRRFHFTSNHGASHNRKPPACSRKPISGSGTGPMPPIPPQLQQLQRPAPGATT